MLSVEPNWVFIDCITKLPIPAEREDQVFGLRKIDTASVVETPAVVKMVPVIPFPEKRIANPVHEPEVYDATARKLKFAPEELVRSRVLAFLRDSEIQVYDYDQVNAYMTMVREQAEKDFWYWRPLRQKDNLDYTWGTCPGFPQQDGYYDPSHNSAVYQRLVPKHALDKIILLERKFKNQLAFFVSDYGDPKPDPFLGVRPRLTNDVGDPLIVVDVWDEPGFGS